LKKEWAQINVAHLSSVQRSGNFMFKPRNLKCNRNYSVYLFSVNFNINSDLNKSLEWVHLIEFVLAPKPINCSIFRNRPVDHTFEKMFSLLKNLFDFNLLLTCKTSNFNVFFVLYIFIFNTLKFSVLKDLHRIRTLKKIFIIFEKLWHILECPNRVT
jgi:hypothetical protein